VSYCGGNRPLRGFRARVRVVARPARALRCDKLGAVDPDLELLGRWQGGDARAGEELFARHFPDLYRFFEHKLGGDADDLVQQTFVACVKARDAFRRQSSFRTFLFAIARNQLYSFLRKLPPGEHVDFELTSIAELVTSLGSRLGRARLHERLRLALAELPAEQQLLLELHYWHELDAEALAEVFETTSGAIRVRLVRARRSLRSRLGAVDAAAAPSDGLVAALSRGEDDDP